MLLITKSRSSELARSTAVLNAAGEMPELTNLTDRISHLRDRKASSPLVQGGGEPKGPKKRARKKPQAERKFATDYFMLFVYALLAVALVAQLALIVWLDVI